MSRGISDKNMTAIVMFIALYVLGWPVIICPLVSFICAGIGLGIKTVRCVLGVVAD